MNKLLWIFSLAVLSLYSFGQDTISTNIYQYDSNLGIGITAPSYFLEIKNDVNSGIKRNFIKLQNVDNSSYTGLLFQTGTDGAKLSGFQEYGLNYNSGPHYDFGGFFNISSKVRGIMLHANSADGIIKFYTGHDETAGAGIERLRIDAEGNIGIGTDSPEHALSIEGTETSWPQRIFLSVNNKSAGSNSLAYIRVKAGPSSNQTILGHISETYMANDSPQDLQDYGIVSSNGEGLIISASRNNLKPGIIKFVSGQSSGTTFDERMRIDSTGNIGIGTKKPEAKLEIADGDIYISDIEKGIIMKSPDGNCWKGVLDNNGNLNFTEINCPEVALKNESVLKSSSKVSVYPNPVENSFNIVVGDGEFKKLKYSVYDLKGRILDRGKITNNHKILNISSYESGIYLVKVFDNEGIMIASNKMIKK